MEAYSPPCPVCPSWFGDRAESKRRKKGAANIFQDVELSQIQALFRKSGDEKAEERARIVWGRQEGDQSVGPALMELRAKKKTRSFFHHNKSAAAEFLGLMWIKAFSKMRLGDCGSQGTRSSLWQRSQMKRKRLKGKRTVRSQV
ncbi:uncharacterized protein avpi1 [Callorhinchus milii]|uniref:Arginine vasopressin-induced protein 1 n=1 Tax=Callorhinchus milii TaxID=7868 RepID=V9LHB0_CALMI|nr:uncharacterized protein avpi1 [Callorhinchus milii]|eukprot:gi/632988352/ref/XP_007883063.1/ PREDICTED: uncharacterized protein LOC103172066 [Callorhinchus milii]